MFSQFACHQLPNYTENANFQIRISQNVKNRLYAPLLVNPRYRPVLLFLISKRYWGETILSPQYPGEYWGESPCCPCGVGAYEYIFKDLTRVTVGKGREGRSWQQGRRMIISLDLELFRVRSLAEAHVEIISSSDGIV